jgi:purine-nucleoside phosphorylase
MTQPQFTRTHYQQAADYIRTRTQHTPSVALILGSGLGALAEAIQDADRITSTDIPNWPRSTVEGHAGKIIIGNLEGLPIFAQQGRVHFYEGLSMQEITFPTRVMFELGIRTLIVTNAAGGINQSFHPGDIMLITDHINLPGMIGHSPILGPNDETLGPRFPDMGIAYDRALRETAAQVAVNAGIELQQGVYCCLSGPAFETPAEVRFLKTMGADAVGMSTAPEVTVARHCGMKVLGFSGITNVHRLDMGAPTTHEEVLETGKQIGPKLATILKGVTKAISSNT